MALKGLIAEKKRRLGELELLADGYITSIRDILWPYAEDFTELKIDVALSEMKELHRVWEEARKLKQELSKLEAEL